MNYTITSQLTSTMELEGVYMRRQSEHPPWLGLSKERQPKLVKVGAIKKSRQNSTFLNPLVISLALIIYFISNQSFITIMSAGKNLSYNNESTRAQLISFAAASPAPEPSPARRTSSSSSAHRSSPPMNGSIFGKRSVATVATAGARAQESAKKLTTDESLITRKQERPQANKASGISEDVSKAEIISYKDIITEIIEDFLAMNNESDPEEASVAFCRMIVYECSQMLTARSKSLSTRRKVKRISSIRF